MRCHGFTAAVGFFLLGLALCSGAERAMALAPGQTHQLQPHRAIYEMTLDSARPGSGVTGLLGRMVFEFNGSRCEGYTLNMRLVTRVADRQGNASLTDLRSSTWEEGEGSRFRFNTSQYNNQTLYSTTTGDAQREKKGGKIMVRLKRPSKLELQLPGEALFPTQHSHVLLKAAHEGQSVLQADIYDGSDKGDKMYATTAFIGKVLAPGEDKSFEVVKNGERLSKLKSWPVSISYFDGDKTGEVMPSYQLGFRLYANGVSRKLLIDYGDFRVRGALSALEFLDAPLCR